jgi:glycosyltransferase involved in cell wall biosynthesis
LDYSVFIYFCWTIFIGWVFRMSNKVLFFVDSPVFGGVEQALLQLMEGLDRAVWWPVLVHHPSENLQYLIRKVDELQIKRIETPPMPLGIRGMKSMVPFLKIIHREQPVVFHAHLSWPLGCKWGVVASILAHVPAIIVTEQLFLDISYTRMSYFQQRLLSTWMGKYITVSCDIADKMREVFHIPDQKIRVIHNAVEPAKFEDSTLPEELTELRKKITKPLILTVARLDEQKGHRDLLKAAVEIPEAIFAFLGDGPERSDLEEYSRELGVAERIIFLGFRSDVANWLNACDLFVLPSLFEGLPISILEAMCAGKPVIATAIPGNEEAVIEGQTGYLTPPRDPGSLAAAIRSMLADPEMRSRMGRAGKEIVLQKYSAPAMIRQITEVYAECLGDRYPTHG